MNNSRKNFIASCEVSEIAEFELGGYRQKVLIEGKSKNLPVILCLHGGPGFPMPFSVGTRGLFPEWKEKAVMVFWDQLGCGVNRRRLDGFVPDDFVRMTCDLIVQLKNKFPQNKLLILGVSWGSMLALKSVVRVSCAVDGVVIGGQIVKNLFFNEGIVSAFSAAPEKIKAKVKGIMEEGKDCAWERLDKNLFRLTRYIEKYTDGRISHVSKIPPMGKIIQGMAASPDYSLRDFKAVFKNDFKGNESIWRALLAMDLSAELARVAVPYHIIQGETDLITPTDIALKAVEACGNPNVSCSVVARSGHIPSEEGMKEIFDSLYRMAYSVQ